jgi:predicted nucleic-acid-binding Zn-ribbon protein
MPRMKRSLQCPKCAGRRLWVVEQVQQVDASGEYADRVISTPLGLTAARLGEGGSSLRMSTVGRFEAWTCHGCGYTELYARDFAQALAHLAANPANGVRFVDGSAPPQGPFR